MALPTLSPAHVSAQNGLQKLCYPQHTKKHTPATHRSYPKHTQSIPKAYPKAPIPKVASPPNGQCAHTGVRQSRRLAAFTESDSAKPAQDSREAAESVMPQSTAAPAAAAAAMAGGLEAGQRADPAQPQGGPSLVQASTMYASANVLRGLVRARASSLAVTVQAFSVQC